MAHVFISYSKQDIAFARHLRQLLENADFPVWMDETALVPSERWWRQIEQNIRSCAAFIVIMSPNSQASDWVEREILLAERLRKPIFPLLLAGEAWSRLANIQYVPAEDGLRDGLPEELHAGLARFITPTPGQVQRVPPPLDESVGSSPGSGQRSRVRRALIPAALGTLVFLALLFVVPTLTAPTATPTPTLTPTLAVTTTPTVPPLLPNLSVGRLRVSPRVPVPGQVFILSMTITNNGEGESGAFSWSWDASLDPPVRQNTLIGRVESIPPNGSKNISFPVSYGWWGAYNTQLVVDVDSEVLETDERDNRGLFAITLSSDPFEIDFSLRPPADLVEPPFDVVEDSFTIWNLRFSLVPPDGVECPEARLQIVEADGDMVLQASGVVGSCERSRIRIDILRDSIGAALVEIVPTVDDESATVFYFDSPQATSPFESVAAVNLTAGEPVLLGADDDAPRAIRRVEIAVNLGKVSITRIMFMDPA